MPYFFWLVFFGNQSGGKPPPVGKVPEVVFTTHRMTHPTILSSRLPRSVVLVATASLARSPGN